MEIKKAPRRAGLKCLTKMYKPIIARKRKYDNDYYKKRVQRCSKKIATGMTEFYSKLIVKLYGQDNEEWIYNKEEVFDNANTILNERMANNDAIETIFENLAYTASVLRLFTILKENEQEETVQKEFDVEEILREAGSEQE